AIDEFPQLRKVMKIAYKADMIERGRLQNDLDLIVVAVQSSARMIIGKSANDVRGGERKAFTDRVHVRPTASTQRSRTGGQCTGSWPCRPDFPSRASCFDRVGCDRVDQLKSTETVLLPLNGSCQGRDPLCTKCVMAGHCAAAHKT